MDLAIEIQKLEERHLNSDICSSVSELDDLLADDFIEFGSSGRVWILKGKLEASTEAVVMFEIFWQCNR